MSRLAATFARLKGTPAGDAAHVHVDDRGTLRASVLRRGGLVTYTTAGDPDPATSAEILVAIAEAGADVLEVGVPFSDPVADGPVIQRATERALRAGMTLRGTLDLVRQVRAKIAAPIVVFTYANPVVRMGPHAFATAARDAGVDGALILDYPIEEAEPLRQPLVEAGLDPIFLISPTTTDDRIRQASAKGSGFLYVISRLGITGARDNLAGGVDALVTRVRRESSLPVALGFGISRPEHVAAACAVADAAVVGSALVSVIAEQDAAAAPDVAASFVRWLKSDL